MNDYPPIGAEVKAMVKSMGWYNMVLTRKENCDSNTFYKHKLYWKQIDGDFECSLGLVTDWFFVSAEKSMTRRMV